MILDGKKTADRICEDLKTRVTLMKERGYTDVKLKIVTSGDDDASKVYVRNKVRRCEEIGISATVSHHDILSADNAFDEYLAAYLPTIYQMPISGDLTAEEIGVSMSPSHDVDGFCTKHNIARLATGMEPHNLPCTPKGIMRLLSEYGIRPSGKTVCIIGRSNIVGRPLARLMEQANATVILCHSKTSRNTLIEAVKMADIVVSAVGKTNVISLDEFDDGDFTGKVLIDVGMNRDENGKLCGDFDKRILEKCAAYTPVPGGVGPMTVAMLMENVVEYYERLAGLS